ncbi:MAG: hypothetical protein A2Y80_05985 [Deltaproteobacteria bacterium RBG_13_58_19]|nr:MAG: hypothetical protein A2Y80_05985 [Deltaproteobacteria bacterium RBG_13_58_19]
MGKVIPFSQLARQQHLNFLKHKRREYREREDYLLRLRKLLFQIEGQMRQAEVLQLDLFRQLADHFHITLAFPSQGDRLEMHRFFSESPFLVILTEFFSGSLSLEECYQKITALMENLPPAPKE